MKPKPWRGLELMLLVVVAGMAAVLALLGLGELAIMLTEGPP